MPPKPTTYIGIDPGKNGGIAFVHSCKVTSYKIPENETTLFQDLQDTTARCRPNCAVIEQQIPRPTRFFDLSSATWKSSILKSTCVLYGQYMQLRAFLIALEVPFEEVVPEIWQQSLGTQHRAKGMTDSQWKNILKKKAQEIFPDTKVTLWSADALLIAEYCRRQHTPSHQRKKMF